MSAKFFANTQGLGRLGKLLEMTGDLSDNERAMEVIQAILESEDWFEQRIRDHMLQAEAARPGGEMVEPGSSYPMLSTPMWHTHLKNLVQFLFFLEALQCTDPQSIERFVDRHNEKIKTDLKMGTHTSSKAETEKAVFSERRQKQLVATFAHYGKPIFTAVELGHLLIDLMSAKTTENMVADLRLAGLLTVRGTDSDPFDAPIGTDSRRELLEPDPLLVESYCQSLLQVRERL